ncbi:hypothetical protein DL95DRAFT_452609 [Leptodontidium sp. 2 PMI_412]|nr:hypothetical protein DL95DRAFT_452609 [Leptodontidium sp. 2 PMI_412]
MLGKGQFTFINKDASNIDTKDHKVEPQETKAAHSNKSLASRNKNYGFELLMPVVSNEESDGDGLNMQNSRADLKPVPMRKISLSDPTSDSVLHEQLDPFLSLAGSTTLYERNLLHYYLITTPRNLYGTHNTSLYCPVRERTVMFVQRSSVWLKCVLLSAEIYKLAGMAAEESISVLYHKTLLYKLVREEQSKHTSFGLDN